MTDSRREACDRYKSQNTGNTKQPQRQPKPIETTQAKIIMPLSTAVSVVSAATDRPVVLACLDSSQVLNQHLQHEEAAETLGIRKVSSARGEYQSTVFKAHVCLY